MDELGPDNPFAMLEQIRQPLSQDNPFKMLEQVHEPLRQPLSQDNPFGMLAKFEGPLEDRVVKEVKIPEFLQSQLRGERTWDEVAPQVKKQFGVDPETYRQSYQLGEAHAVQKGQPLSMSEAYRQHQPFGFLNDASGVKAYGEAKKRYDDGKGTQEDAGTIAQYERIQGQIGKVQESFAGKVVTGVGGLSQLGAEMAVGGAVLGQVARVPGAIGRSAGALGFGAEAAAPASLAGRIGQFAGNRAALTATAPSFFVDQARQANFAAGREADDIRGYPTTVVMGYANNLVLGSLQSKLGAGLPGGLIGRSAAKGSLGAAEAAGVEVAGGIADQFLNDAYKTNTKFGSIGKLLGIGQPQDVGGAFEDFAATAVTFSLFSGLHGAMERPSLDKAKAKEALDKAVEVIDSAKTPEEAAQKLKEIVKEVPEPPKNPPDAPTKPVGKFSQTLLDLVETRPEILDTELRAGTLGDWITGSQTREYLKEVLDTRVVLTDSPLGMGLKPIVRPSNTTSAGGFGFATSADGKKVPTIVITSKDPERIKSLLIEEAGHALDIKRGVQFDPQDFTKSHAELQKHPAEISVKKHIEAMSKLDVVEAPQDSSAALPLDGVPDAVVKKIASRLGMTVVGLRKRQNEAGAREGIYRELGLPDPQMRPAATPEPPGKVPAEAEIAPQSKPGEVKLGRGEVRLGDAEAGKPRHDGLLQTRRPLLGANGEEIGHVLVRASGGTLHVDWTGLKGMGAKDVIAKGGMGAAATRGLLVQLAKAYPDAMLLKFTPAEGRLNAGKARHIDLEAIRNRGEPKAPAEKPERTLQEVAVKAGLNPRELHLIQQRLVRRSFESIGADPEMGRPGLPYTRQNMEKIQKAAVAKLGGGDPVVGKRIKAALEAVGAEEALGNRESRKAVTGEEFPDELSRPAPDRLNDLNDRILGELERAKAAGVDPMEQLDRMLPGALAIKTERQAKKYLAELTRREKELEKKEKDNDKRTAGVAGEDRQDDAGSRPAPAASGVAGKEEAGKPAKLTPEQLKRQREKNLFKPKTLEGSILDNGGIRTRDAGFVGLDVEGLSIKEGGKKGLFRTNGRALEDIIPELVRSGDLPDIRAGELLDISVLAEILGEKLKAGALLSEQRSEAGVEKMSEAHYKAGQEAENRRRAKLTPEERQAEKDIEAERPLDPEFDQGLPGFVADLGDGVMFSGLGGPLVTRIFRSMGKAIFGKAPGKDADFKPAASSPDLPMPLPSYDVVTRQAANQLGARNTTRYEYATTALAYTRQLAQNFARAWRGSRTAAEPFKDDPAFHDRIEAEQRNPGSQKLTPEEQTQLKVWNEVWHNELKNLEAEGVKSFRDEVTHEELSIDQLKARGYMHRAVEPKADLITAMQGIGSKPGSRAAFRKGRKYDTAAEGVAAGVKYKGFYDTVSDFIYQAKRTVADHRLAKDPKLGGEDLVQPKIAREMAEAKPILDALKGTPEYAELKQAIVRHAYEDTTGNVTVAPAFRTKRYPDDVKAHLERMYGERMGDSLKVVEAASNELRGLVLAVDASYGMLQMQGMSFSNPGRWAKAMAGGMKSLIWDGAFERYVQHKPERMAAMNEFVQSGGNLGTRPEGTNVGTGRSLIEKVPVVGQAYVRAQRAMTTALDIAKVELWQANRPDDPKQWSRAAEAIEDSLGSGRMEQLGMRPEQALVERILFLAPSYYRAHKRLLEHAFRGDGAARRIAVKQLGFLAGGVMLTSIAALYASRLRGDISDEELEERLNPGRGKFLMVPVTIGDKKLEVGFGGFYVNMVSTLARAKKYAESEGETENPIIRWYKGHAGMVPRAALDTATGTDYSGRPTTLVETGAKAILPLAAQDVLLGEGDTKQRFSKAGTGMLGLRSYPGSESGEYFDKLRKLAQEKTGRRYEDLSIPEQERLVKQLGLTDEKPPSTPGAKQKAIEADELRVKRLTKAVASDTRKRLEEFSHKLPSYETKLSGVPLTKSRQDRFEKLLAEEYDRSVGEWSVDRLRTYSAKSREDYIRQSLEDAKERAKAKLIRESVKIGGR